MDIFKLYEKVLSYDKVKHIPMMYVYTVICCVIDAISSGECFYETEINLWDI